jgi:uncharacterized membrane protein YedE/YeeE
MTSRIPFVIAILTLISGVFISIIFGVNEDFFKDKIKEGLSKNEKITESPNISVSVLATLVKMNISIGPMSKLYKRIKKSSNFALFQKLDSNK